MRMVFRAVPLMFRGKNKEKIVLGSLHHKLNVRVNCSLIYFIAMNVTIVHILGSRTPFSLSMCTGCKDHLD